MGQKIFLDSIYQSILPVFLSPCLLKQAKLAYFTEKL